MKASFILAAATGLFSSVSGQFFSAVALSSGSPIHLQSISANDKSLWIRRKTGSYCPDNVRKLHGCPSGKETNFVGGDGGLGMGTVVPGGT